MDNNLLNKHTTRRNFLKALVGGGVLLSGGAFLARNYRLEDAATANRDFTDTLNPRYLRQIITADPSTSRTLMWQTENKLTDISVEYRPTGQAKVTAVKAADDSFFDDGETNRQYVAHLTNLVPGTSYDYRLVFEGGTSGWHRMQTADTAAPFRCLIFPDSQSSDYGEWAKLAQDAYSRHPDAAFFVNMGDIVDNGEDTGQWRAWFRAVETFAPDIPFVPVMGNHETYSRQWQVRLPIAYLKYFVVPENGSTAFNRYYYSFDYGSVHFAVINTQWEETDKFQTGLLAEQIEWLRDDATHNRQKWKIALLHKDVLQYRIHNLPERTEGFTDVGTSFMPLFDELGFDVVFTAHLHTYRNRGHIFSFHRSAKGPLYILTGIAGNVRYPGLWIDHALDEKIAPQPETDNYLTLDADKDKLAIKCFLPDGREIDNVNLTKN